jgi:RNA polymerase sigma-70 factor, ECF subfamily
MSSVRTSPRRPPVPDNGTTSRLPHLHGGEGREDLPQTDSKSEFSQFYRESAHRVRAYVQQHTRNSHIADDIAHEAFARVWKNWETARKRPIEWTITTARNLTIDHFRHHKYRREILDELSFEETATSVDDDPGISVVRTQYVMRMLQELPDRERDALLLCYMLDLSSAEAARIIGVSHRTLFKLLQRGKRAIRAAVELETSEMGDISGRMISALE